MPTPDHTPTVRARRLGAELRRLREHAGLSPDEAARALGWSRPKLNKFETAARRPLLSEVETLLDFYGAPDQVRLALMQLARDIHKRGWWSAYDDVLTPAFAELEDAASRILTWQNQIIPGLLQTEDFMLALLGSAGNTLDDYEIRQRREARLLRQARLTRRDAPQLDVVLDEAVLRRPIGGKQVMRGQLEALLEAGRRPNVSLRVLSTAAGAYPAIGEGSFVIFELTPDPAVLYLETVIRGLIVEDIERVTRCSVTFSSIADAALSEEESAALITAIINE